METRRSICREVWSRRSGLIQILARRSIGRGIPLTDLIAGRLVHLVGPTCFPVFSVRNCPKIDANSARESLSVDGADHSWDCRWCRLVRDCRRAKEFACPDAPPRERPFPSLNSPNKSRVFLVPFGNRPHRVSCLQFALIIALSALRVRALSRHLVLCRNGEEPELQACDPRVDTRRPPRLPLPRLSSANRSLRSPRSLGSGLPRRGIHQQVLNREELVIVDIRRIDSAQMAAASDEDALHESIIRKLRMARSTD